jgi:CRISPR-associated protein Csy1
VFKFLSLVLSDGKTTFKHLELSSEKIKDDLKVASISFEELSAGLLSIKKTDETVVTSEKVKQVYFSVADNYHLLSLLTPSGLIFELRNRIQKIRFSEQVKKAKEDKRKNIYNDVGFDDLYKLSMIGYGGTKPQNISVLNSKYGGKAYLLLSIPPLLTKQNQPLPKNNFFINTLRPKSFEEDFIKLHKLLKTDYRNIDIRTGINRRIQYIIDGVIEKMWSIRLQVQGWSTEKKFSQLPVYQKIWLDDSRKEARDIDNEWLHEVITECTRWFIFAYEKVLGKKAIKLSDDAFVCIKTIIEENEDELR